jgi:hypothetical protein
MRRVSSSAAPTRGIDVSESNPYEPPEARVEDPNQPRQLSRLGIIVVVLATAQVLYVLLKGFAAFELVRVGELNPAFFVVYLLAVGSLAASAWHILRRGWSKRALDATNLAVSLFVLALWRESWCFTQVFVAACMVAYGFTERSRAIAA